MLLDTIEFAFIWIGFDWLLYLFLVIEDLEILFKWE